MPNHPPPQESATDIPMDRDDAPLQTHPIELGPTGTDDRRVEQDAAALQEQLRRGVRAWGTWSLVLGVLHLIAGGFLLNAPWGILLVLVGLASLVWWAAEMFVVYAVVLAWAGLYNLLLSLNPTWIGLGILQLFLVIGVVRQYLRFRRTGTGSRDVGHDPARVFSGAGCALGALSGAAYALLLGVVVVSALRAGGEVPAPGGPLEFGIGSAVNAGVLAVAVGAAALLGRYPRRWLAALGLLGGLGVVLVDLAFSFL